MGGVEGDEEEDDGGGSLSFAIVMVVPNDHIGIGIYGR